MTSEPSRRILSSTWPALGLAALAPHAGLLDTVRDRVAQQMLERRQHRLEHLPVDLVAFAFDDELRLLTRVGARLTHDALQARHVPLERHHARLHEPALQIRGHARLLRQQRIGFVREAVQSSLMLATSFADSASARESC